jgi:hypothetical protein
MTTGKTHASSCVAIRRQATMKASRAGASKHSLPTEIRKHQQSSTAARQQRRAQPRRCHPSQPITATLPQVPAGFNPTPSQLRAIANPPRPPSISCLPHICPVAIIRTATSRARARPNARLRHVISAGVAACRDACHNGARIFYYHQRWRGCVPWRML